MRNVFAVMAALVLLALGSLAQANVFDLGAGFTNLETVAVGDPGNAGELSGHGNGDADIICGSVAYNYSIGKYEVTAKQYTDFLNAKAKTDDHGLYNSDMADITNYPYVGCNIQRSGASGNYSYSVADDWANRPVNYVDYWDSCRFANWLSNGQRNGDTETGAYTLNGYDGDDGRTIQRNAGWTWAVTSEDEWYKAAYYKGGGGSAGYWDYATQSDVNDSGMANYGWIVGHTTDVGSYGLSSACGTFDQGGNVWEWNESIVYQGSEYAYRVLRGGALSSSDSTLQASYRSFTYPANEYYKLCYVGFRVVQYVPEPAPVIALAGGLVGFVGMRRRRA